MKNASIIQFQKPDRPRPAARPADLFNGRPITTNEKRLLQLFGQLNGKGQLAVIERTAELLDLKKYTSRTEQDETGTKK